MMGSWLQKIFPATSSALWSATAKVLSSAFSLLSGQLSASPGLKVRITQKGLEYAKEVGLEILKQSIEKEHFPDLTGHEKFWLGNVKYNISRIHVTAVELPSASISLLPGSGIKLVIGNASLTIDMNWNIRTWMFFLPNFFIKYLKKPIHRSLVTNSCPNIRAGVQLIDGDLRSPNAVMQIDDLAEVDYSLSGLPAVFQPFIDLDSKTCSYFNINTEIFSSIIPEVAKYSVTPYPVMLKLMPTEIPIISLQQNSFMVEIQGSVEVLAILPDSTTQSLFTLNIAANTSISLNIFNQKFMGSLCLNRIQFSLAHSNVGSFEVLLLENILSYILQTEVIPSANAKLSKGFPLPNLANVTLTRPHITIVQGYVLISTDVHDKH